MGMRCDAMRCLLWPRLLRKRGAGASTNMEAAQCNWRCWRWWWLWDGVYMAHALLHSTVKMTVLPLCVSSKTACMVTAVRCRCLPARPGRYRGAVQATYYGLVAAPCEGSTSCRQRLTGLRGSLGHLVLEELHVNFITIRDMNQLGGTSSVARGRAHAMRRVRG